jgi:hypothetical protein
MGTRFPGLKFLKQSIGPQMAVITTRLRLNIVSINLICNQPRAVEFLLPERQDQTELLAKCQISHTKLITSGYEPIYMSSFISTVVWSIEPGFEVHSIARARQPAVA